MPAAVASSLLGLVVFYGSLADRRREWRGERPRRPAPRRGRAVTSFLVFAGLLLIVFVEPPIEWFAVVEPGTPDRRPTLLALALGLGYVAMLLIPPARDFFSFAVPGPRESVLVMAAVIVWVPTVRAFWRRRLIERFMGVRAS